MASLENNMQHVHQEFLDECATHLKEASNEVERKELKIMNFTVKVLREHDALSEMYDDMLDLISMEMNSRYLVETCRIAWTYLILELKYFPWAKEESVKRWRDNLEPLLSDQAGTPAVFYPNFGRNTGCMYDTQGRCRFGTSCRYLHLAKDHFDNQFFK